MEKATLWTEDSKLSVFSELPLYNKDPDLDHKPFPMQVFLTAGLFGNVIPINRNGHLQTPVIGQHEDLQVGDATKKGAKRVTVIIQAQYRRCSGWTQQ